MKAWKRAGDESGLLERAVREASEILKSHRITGAVGDRYAAGWTVEAFQRRGIRYEQPKVRDGGGTVRLTRSKLPLLKAHLVFTHKVLENVYVDAVADM